MNKLSNATFSLSLLALVLFNHNSACAETYMLHQAIFDGVDGIDGLDNPRQVKLSPDEKYVWVTSADDNSLLILELKEALTPLHIFKNEKALDLSAELKLEGANGLALLDDGTSAVVASFYDSALSSFKKDKDSKFIHSELFTDNLGYERVFKSNKSLSKVDDLGLLGAWDISVSSDEKQLFIASYISDAISVFDVNEDFQLTFNSKITSNDLSSSKLGKPVSLVFLHVDNELIVAGHEGNVLNIFSVGKNGGLTHKQTISNGENLLSLLVNPQYIALSSDNKFVYVACSGSSAILVFERTDKEYVFVQALTPSQSMGSGLTGVAAMAISNDGSQLYAAGEFDKGLLRFERSDDGRLHYKETIQSKENKIEGVTSIAISKDGQNILLSLGKKDALYLLKQHSISK